MKLVSPGAWRLWRPVVVGVVVLAISWLSILFTRYDAQLAPFWPGNAVALVLLLRTRGDARADFVAIAVGMFLANTLAGSTALMAALFTVCNFCDIGVAYAVMRWPLSPAAPEAVSSNPRRMFIIVCGVVCAPAVGATLAGLVIAPLVSMTFAAMWIGWWLPSTLALLIIAPIGLLVSSADAERLRRPGSLVEAIACLAVLLLVAGIIVLAGRVGFLFLATPVILFAGFRFRTMGAAFAVAVTALCATPVVAGVFGPVSLGTWEPTGAILMVQAFLMVTGTTALVLAAVLDQRDALLNALNARESIAATQAEAKSRLLMNVSHEIRTPLNVIQGLGEMLIGKGGLDPRQQTLVEGILGSSRRLQALAHDLLDTARIERGALRIAPELFRPAPVLRSLIAEELHQAGGDAVIQLDVAPDLEMWGDPLRVQQIAQNLLSNAIKYSAGHGQITIGVRVGARTARMEVIDRGPGFPAGATHLAFEPFAGAGRGQATGRSAGVGLSLVKLLAEAHGGTVGCSSTPHVETRVWAELPLQHAPSARRAVEDAESDEPDPAEIFGACEG